MRARHLDDPYRRKRERMTRWLQAREISRRQVLQRAGVALVAAGWAPSLQAAEAPKAGGVMNFMSWEGYDFPEQMADWKKANGVEVQATYMGSHDDIQAKILGGGGEGLDLITYGSSYKQLYSALKILTPIDESKIPNLPNLLPFFESDVQNIWVDPDGTRTGVPADWGAVGISYNSAMITEAPSLIRHPVRPEVHGQGRHARRSARRLRPGGPRARAQFLTHDRGRLHDGDQLAEGPGQADQGHLAVLRRRLHAVHRRRHRPLLPRLGGLQVVRRGGRQEHHRNGVARERRGAFVLQRLGHPARRRQCRHGLRLDQRNAQAGGECRNGQVSGRRGGGGGRRSPARPGHRGALSVRQARTNFLPSRRCSRTPRSNPISTSPVSASWRHGRR